MSFRTSPGSHRTFAVMTLLVLGLGYLLAQVYLYSKKVHPAIAAGETVVQGVANTYHGVPDAEPRLLVSLKGSMAPMVTPGEYRAVEEWIAAGCTEEAYEGRVEALIERTCASCHGPNGTPPVIMDYDDALKLTKPDSGMDVTKLAKMTHIHLLGIPMLFFMVGALFIRTRWNEWLKGLIVLMSWGGVVFDIAHWWITKVDARAAAGIIVGGAIMGTGFGLQMLLTLLDVFLPYRPKSLDEPENTVP